MDKECKYLSNEEMSIIEKGFEEQYEDYDNSFVIHELDSKFVHSDIVIMRPNDKNKDTILYTIGMSNTIMPGNNRCEIMTKFPKEAFKETLSCELCDNGKKISECIDDDYKHIINDMIKISKMPEKDGELYENGNTISIIGDKENRNYALKQVFSIKDINILYLHQLK